MTKRDEALKNNGIAVKIVGVIAALTVLGAVILGIAKGNEPEKEAGKVSTPDQLVYGLTLDKAVDFDTEALKSYYKNELMFSDYSLADEYTMIYQVSDSDGYEKMGKIFGLKEALPTVDYKEKYLMLSVGREIEKISVSAQNSVDAEHPIYAVDYSEKYTPGRLYVYKMKPVKMMSGVEYEQYCWENLLPNGNLVPIEQGSRETVSAGLYHRQYKTSNGHYEYELLSLDGKTAIKRFLKSEQTAVKEISDTLVKIDEGASSFYYNPTRRVLSEGYDFKTEHLIYNIITYMRVKNGEIQLILRDAYDSTAYAKIVKLPFTEDTENIDSLVKSIKVLDDTHIEVEYYTGVDRRLITEKVEVYNLKR